MKNKNNVHYIGYFLIIVLIAFSIFISSKGSQNNIYPTGGSHLQFNQIDEKNYAYTLGTWINKFFEIDDFVFPKSACTDIAQQFLQNFKKKSPQVTEHFTTTGPQRISSRLFGIKQEFAGVIEMIHGKDLINEEGIDSILNFWVEGVVRLPKISRASGIEFILCGETKEKFYVKHGKIKTPIMDCTFEGQPDGTAICDCKIERTHDYINQ